MAVTLAQLDSGTLGIEGTAGAMTTGEVDLN